MLSYATQETAQEGPNIATRGPRPRQKPPKPLSAVTARSAGKKPW
jgi:hypothetical protein